MGIVVTIAMLFGLTVLRPTPWRSQEIPLVDLRMIVFICVFLFLAGCWNFLWYGLRNFGDFWGLAALVSGVAMVLAALIIFLEHGDPKAVGMTWISTIRTSVIWTLAVCFLLYAVTLIQLNLGFPIIG